MRAITLRLTFSRCAGLAVMLASFTGLLAGQVADESSRAQKTAFVSCCDENGQNCRSRTVRGPVLLAPNSKHRAYVEVSAQIVGKLPGDYDMPDCRNRTTVFVSTDGKTFKSVDEEVAREGADGNGVQLIDWSPDSKTLLSDVIVWKYYSEGWTHYVAVHSVDPRESHGESLNELFSEATKQPCTVDAELVGFLPDGQIGVRTNPMDETEDTPCAAEGTWAIDPWSFKLRPVAQDVSIKHNGHFETSR